MRPQASQEAAHLLLLIRDFLARERFHEQLLESRVALFRRAIGEIGALNLESAALVDKLCIWPAEVPHASVQDLGDGSHFALEGVDVAWRVAAHVPNEHACAIGRVGLGVDDSLNRRDREAHGLLDEDVLARPEAADDQGLMAVVGRENEDHFDLGIVDDLIGVGGLMRNVKFGRAVIDVRLGDVADRLNLEQM